MLHALLVDMKLDKFTCYRNLETTAIESACAEIEVAQLQDILKKYTAAEDMFTQQYLHGRNENIKLLVDIGKAVETPEAAFAMYEKLKEREPIYVRCLVEAFKTWHRKTAHTSSPEEILPEVQHVSITDLKEQLPDTI